MNKKLMVSSFLMTAVATPIIATSLNSYQIKNENKNEIKIENNAEKFKEMRWSKIPSYEKLNSSSFSKNEIKNTEPKAVQNRNLPPQTIVYIIISAVVGLVLILIIIFIIIAVINHRRNKKLLRRGPRIVRRPPVQAPSTNAQLAPNIESKQVNKTVELNKSVVNASMSPTGKVEVKNEPSNDYRRVQPTPPKKESMQSMPNRKVQPTPPKKASTQSTPNRKAPPTPPKKTATKKQTKAAAKKAKKTATKKQTKPAAKNTNKKK